MYAKGGLIQLEAVARAEHYVTEASLKEGHVGLTWIKTAFGF
jgi:hypothetical protein